MKEVTIKNANIHNLKNISVRIPLNKLVVAVGPSGSGKTSLIYDVLYKSSEGKKVGCNVSKTPKTYAINQKITIPKNLKLSLGEYNQKKLSEIVSKLKKGELLIADELCAGLNKKESLRVLSKFKTLVSEGKSVIAIEHSKEIIQGADHIIEFGPKAGKYWGKIIFQGDLDQFKKIEKYYCRLCLLKQGRNNSLQKKSERKGKGYAKEISNYKGY